MGGIARVVGVERSTVDGVPVVNVIADPGGEANANYEHFAPAGDDSPPLPDDAVAYVDGEGEGQALAAGYNDTKNAGTAAPGEKRIYGRTPDGTLVNEFWLKGDGSFVYTDIKNGKSLEFKDGKLNVDGDIVATGSVSADGEVTANASATPTKLSTHKHPTAGNGPPSPPIPGT